MQREKRTLDILLDMDGVVVDWVTPVARLFGREKDELIPNWPRGKFDIENVLPGVTSDILWSKINERGEDFWAEMPEMPWARRLYDGCKERGNVYFLTAPSNKGGCLAGKLRWMQKFTGDEWFKNYLIGKPKFLCGKPGSILVDDADKNIDAFNEEGGYGILLPHVWNTNHHIEMDPIDYVFAQIDEHKKSIQKRVI